MNKATICVVGSINMDLVVRTPVLPAPGQTVLGGPFGTFPGGKGANQAVAAARAGGRVTLVACVGDDAAGEELAAGLAAELIDVGMVLRRPGVTTGVALIAVDPAGQNTIIVAPGANAALEPADLLRAEGAIATADVLLVQLEVPLPAVAAAIGLARRHGVRVILNPAPALPLDDSLLALADVVVPNESEAAALTGIRPDGWEGAARAAQALRARGPGAVVLTLGGRGALLADGDGLVEQPAFAVAAVDATAAGDAFVGALAVALAEGRPPREALRWASAAGALATTIAGARPSLPPRQRIERLALDG